jgi:phage terminase large subunit GpA-like protein
MDSRIAALVYQSWTPPDRSPLIDWSYRNIVLAGSYAKPGRLDLNASPWLRRPAESLMNHRVQRVNLLAGVQTFKSGLGQVYNQYRIAEDPAQIMHNFQTEDVAKDMWRKRIEPTMEASPATRDILPTLRTKRSRNVISFPGCDYTVQGGGKNESNLQTDSFQVVNNDEVWIWDHGNIAQAEARADAFGEMRKIINSSQAAEKDSEWDQVFNSGLVHTLTVKCPGCRKRHPFLWSYKLADSSWSGVVWERKKYLDGTPNGFLYSCGVALFCGFNHALICAAHIGLIRAAFVNQPPNVAFCFAQRLGVLCDLCLCVE